MRLDASSKNRVLSSFTIFAVISISLLLYGCGGIETPAVEVPTGSVTLAWEAPTVNEDGSPITDLAGYRVYYGETSQAYTDVVNVGNSTGASIGGLPIGIPLYFSVTAYDLSGNQSTFSSEVSTVLSES